MLKLDLEAGQLSFEEMYEIRSLEVGCINNGLTQLQSIFSELIKNKISQSQGLGLRNVLSLFISLTSAFAILFTLSASANNNKVTKATLNFAKQTQLLKVETKKVKKKADQDKTIKQLTDLIDEIRHEMHVKAKYDKEEIEAREAAVFEQLEDAGEAKRHIAYLMEIEIIKNRPFLIIAWVYIEIMLSTATELNHTPSDAADIRIMIQNNHSSSHEDQMESPVERNYTKMTKMCSGSFIHCCIR